MLVCFTPRVLPLPSFYRQEIETQRSHIASGWWGLVLTYESGLTSGLRKEMVIRSSWGATQQGLVENLLPGA